MIIYDLHFMSVFSFPPETNPPPVVDSNAVLPCTIPNKLLKPVSRRGSQILETFSRVQKQ
jgi:hypothetical protein